MALKHFGKTQKERAEEALAYLKAHGWHGRIFPGLSGPWIRLANGDHVTGNPYAARQYVKEHDGARDGE